MIIPHKANISEVDFYRGNLTRSEYVEELYKRSTMKHKFKYKGKIIACAGVLRNPNKSVNNYWQILTVDFPDNYIPLAFIKEFIEYGNKCLNRYKCLTVCLFDENNFARWLLLHGKKRAGWKVAAVGEGFSPNRTVYKIGDYPLMDYYAQLD